MKQPDGTATARDRTPIHRVFFALQPDRKTAAVLARIAEGLLRGRSGRPVPAHNLHLTLAFLGGVDAEGLRRAEQVSPVTCGALRLELDRLGFFRRSQTLWLGFAEPPEALQSLERQLWEGLGAAGFQRERRAFHPHVTIARHSGAAHGPIEPVCWTVDALTLMESVRAEAGVRYRPLRRWPL